MNATQCSKCPSSKGHQVGSNWVGSFTGFGFSFLPSRIKQTWKSVMANNTGPNSLDFSNRKDCTAIILELLGIHAGSAILGKTLEQAIILLISTYCWGGIFSAWQLITCSVICDGNHWASCTIPVFFFVFFWRICHTDSWLLRIRTENCLLVISLWEHSIFFFKLTTAGV